MSLYIKCCPCPGVTKCVFVHVFVSLICLCVCMRVWLCCHIEGPAPLQISDLIVFNSYELLMYCVFCLFYCEYLILCRLCRKVPTEKVLSIILL